MNSSKSNPRTLIDSQNEARENAIPVIVAGEFAIVYSTSGNGGGCGAGRTWPHSRCGARMKRISAPVTSGAANGVSNPSISNAGICMTIQPAHNETRHGTRIDFQTASKPTRGSTAPAN